MLISDEEFLYALMIVRNYCNYHSDRDCKNCAAGVPVEDMVNHRSYIECQVVDVDYHWHPEEWDFLDKENL